MVLLSSPLKSAKAPDLAMAKETVDTAAKSHQRGLPPGARVAPPTAHIVLAGDFPVARGTIATEGLSQDDPGFLAAHTEGVYVFTADAAYAMMVMGPSKHAPALARFADAAAATVKVPAAARPTGNAGEPLGQSVNTAYAVIAAGAILAAALIASKRWRERQALARDRAAPPPAAPNRDEPES